MIGSAMTGAAAGEAFNLSSEPGSPAVLCITPDSITVEYYSFEEDTEPRDNAMQLVADHCHGAYTETRTQKRGLWHGVDARCDQAAPGEGSEPPCELVLTERDGFGESAQENR